MAGVQILNTPWSIAPDMEDVFVGRLMSSPAHTVGPGTPVQTAAQTMIDADIGSLVVVEDDRLVGILTATDFVRAAADGSPTADAIVADYMTEDVITTDANHDIREIAALMTEHGFHHVPVVDGESVIGMISTSDLTNYVSHLERAGSPA